MLYYEEKAPAQPLREYIECYWTLQSDFSLQNELCLPDGSASLIFNFGPNYFRATCHRPNQWQEIGRCSMPHQGKESVLITQQKPVRLLGLRFKPHGMAPFFKVSMMDFPPPFVLFGETLRPFLGDLEEKLWSVDCFEARIAMLNDHFTCRTFDMSAPDDLVKSAISEMVKSAGNLRIGELLDTLCVSKSTLEKKFQEHVGLSPKILSNILRFNSLVYNQQLEPSPSLTELSYNQGFFDQAHLVHSFKAFTGLPPGRFFRQDNLLVEMLRQSFEGRVSEIY
ncbi:MAG: AraC family transcriptional regulator [Lewinellaceae bacterium]|nr:AraC family transcriptional regulator [Lewinellaceae bacterium]